jgi:hypothetical protein
MKILFFPFLVFFFIFSSCKESKPDLLKEEMEINQLLDQWHEDAAKARFEPYFQKMSETSVFIGTDAKENWSKSEFIDYAEPFFNLGKAWTFSSMERNVFVDSSGKMAWFDELLKTRMKICRGSGVLLKKKGQWKIEQYVLSLTVPNELVDSVVGLKALAEDSLIFQLENKAQ